VGTQIQLKREYLSRSAFHACVVVILGLINSYSLPCAPGFDQKRSYLRLPQIAQRLAEFATAVKGVDVDRNQNEQDQDLLNARQGKFGF